LMGFGSIILAGRRKGKLIVERSVLETTIDNVLKLKPEKIVVVVCKEFSDLMKRGDVGVVTISKSTGILCSLKAGIREIVKWKPEWILACLGNQPIVDKEVVEKLILSKPKIMSIPVFMGLLGHPFLFSRKGAEEIINYPDERTMRDFIEEKEVELVEVDTPTILERISPEEDYLLQIKKFKSIYFSKEEE